MDFVFVQERVSTSTKQRRQTHSHSARVAKVKGARKSQAVGHTRQTGSAEHNSDKEINPQPTSRDRQHTQAVVSRGETAVPAPRSLSGAFEYKPLATFLSSLTPREHFLFDYCKAFSHRSGRRKRIRKLTFLLRRQSRHSPYECENPCLAAIFRVPRSYEEELGTLFLDQH